MKGTDAILELKTAGEHELGAFVSREAAREIAKIAAELIDDRKVLLAVMGISEAEFRTVRAAAETLSDLGVKL